MTITRTTRALIGVVLAATVALPFLAIRPALAQAPPPSELQEKIEAIKKAFADSQAKLRGFQWVRTTTVSIDGEVKKTKQEQCYYGVEGDLVKTLISENPPEDSGGRGSGFGWRMRDAEKRNLRKYLQETHNLIDRYLPPRADLIQRCRDVGNSDIRVIVPGQRVAVDFHNFLVENDLLSFEVDPSTNKVLGVSVVSTMAPNQDPITLNVTIGAFPDGTMYTEVSTLSAPARQLTVTVQNAGYVPRGSEEP